MATETSPTVEMWTVGPGHERNDQGTHLVLIFGGKAVPTQRLEDTSPPPEQALQDLQELLTNPALGLGQRGSGVSTGAEIRGIMAGRVDDLLQSVRISNSKATFVLNECYDTIGAGCRPARRRLFMRIRHLLADDDLPACEALMRDVDLDKLDALTAVGVLRATFAARDRLCGWGHTLQRTRKHLVQQSLAADNLLAGLGE